MNVLMKMKGAAMSFKGAASGVLVLLTAAVVHGQDDWSVTCWPHQICALKGSTVTIMCSYKYPKYWKRQQMKVSKQFWFIDVNNNEPVDLKTNPEYSNRVNYHCKDKRCELTVTNLRQSDSHVYKFRFTTNHEDGNYSDPQGVILSVKELHVTVKKKTHYYDRSTGTELTCNSDCQLRDVSYIWFENGKRIKSGKVYTTWSQINPTDRFYCATDGYMMSQSPAVYGPMLPDVSVSPSGEIVEGTSVTLTCNSDANPAASYTWYKGNLKLLNEQRHVFRSIQTFDSGEYMCIAVNDLGRRTLDLLIDVKYPPKFSSVSVRHTGPIEEGRPVTLSCSSDANPAPKYTWYRENKKLYCGSKSVYRVSSVTSEDRGNYVCMSQNQFGQQNSSSQFVDVLYAPKPPTVSVSPSGDTVEDSSVTLTCSSDANPAANYTWYKADTSKPIEFKAQLVFRSIKTSESGQYYCDASNYRGTQTQRVDIDVKYAPKPPGVSVYPSDEIMEGSSVTLTCSSDANPAANYTWYKQGEESPKASGQNFTIRNITREDRGKYVCQVQNRIGQNNSTKHLTVLAESWKSVARGTTAVIFMIIILLVVFLVWKNRNSSVPSPELGESPNIIKQHHQSEKQEEIQYASVRFMKNQTDALYMNFKPAGAPRPTEEKNENVTYATVKVTKNRSNQRSEAPESSEDPPALYSLVR